jgi:DNA-binding NarL/FixJ family response regulator
MAQYGVLLVEDDGETRARLADVIRGEPRLALAGAVATCAEARRLLPLTAPDLLAVDLGLPDGHGSELIRFARREHPKTEVMVITVFGDERSVISAIEAGAGGYLLKDGTPEEIAQALVQLAEGGSPISPAIARHLLRRFQSEPAATGTTAIAGDRAPSLTQREIEVLRLISKGFRFGEIAELLGISTHTVTTHVRHLYAKLEVSSRSAAVWEARHLGLLRSDE